MFAEDEQGYVIVKDEAELKEFCDNGGWDSVEQFEQEHGVKKEEVFGRAFQTVGRGSICFKETIG